MLNSTQSTGMYMMSVDVTVDMIVMSGMQRRERWDVKLYPINWDVDGECGRDGRHDSDGWDVEEREMERLMEMMAHQTDAITRPT